MKPHGMLALILHTHLPHVRHPEHEEFLEERWLFEAMTETYLPLAERFQQLANDQVPFRITMSFTPTLLAMWADPLLQERYVRYLDRLIELSEKEIQRTRWIAPFHRLALFYHHRFTSARRLYLDTYRRNLVQPFRQLADGGWIEPIASCATHGFLPLLAPQPAAVRAQMHIGVHVFERTFGHRPCGFWFPECGYATGLDEPLQALGLRYFLADAHAVLFGSPRPKYGVFAPAVCPSGVAVFGRDLASSNSVWSAAEGYPGHPDYREFYRDIGYDLEYDYIRPYIDGDGTRINTGIKYYRITGVAEEKQPYDPDRALERAAQHAEAFLRARRAQIEKLRALMDRAPLIVTPFDAELFGHWWFEGPDWLETVIRRAHSRRPALELVAPSDYLERYPINQPIELATSSWGQGGYHDVWLNGSNDWLYRHLHRMAERMSQLAQTHPRADELTARALNQMARELLLAQSSDWAFILKAQTHTAYAYRRVRDHLARFTELDEALTRHALDAERLSALEADDNLFPHLDYHLYAMTSSP